MKFHKEIIAFTNFILLIIGYCSAAHRDSNGRYCELIHFFHQSWYQTGTKMGTFKFTYIFFHVQFCVVSWDRQLRIIQLGGRLTTIIL